MGVNQVTIIERTLMNWGYLVKGAIALIILVGIVSAFFQDPRANEYIFKKRWQQFVELLKKLFSKKNKY